ncbi:hypothetical protein BH24DEI2_BH24DEI2_04100 [soil metagenome]
MMKRTLLTICLALLVSLVACERNTEQQADTSGTSVTETPVATDSSSTETTAAETGGTNETVVGTEVVETEVAETGGTETGGSDEIMAETGGSETGGDATAVPETLAETGGTETGGSEVGAVTEAVTETGGAALEESETGGAALAGTETGGAAVLGTETGGVELEGMETGGAVIEGEETGGAETGGAETGGAETGGATLETSALGSETGGSETGGVMAADMETGGAETGGTESGGTESGGAETGGSSSAVSDEAGDLDLIGQTSTALTDAEVEQAVTTIEAWQTRLETLNNPDLAPLSADLETLKAELQADSPDEGTVKTLLYTLGQETSRLALAAPQDVGDALNALGTTLSEAGDESALSDAPVDVAGAMPSGTETGGAETGGGETVGSSAGMVGTAATAAGTQAETGGASAETGGADMNLQTGALEAETGGATQTEPTQRPSSETGGTTATLRTSQIAETGGGETGGAAPMGETGGSAMERAETGGAETGGGISPAAVQENVESSQAPEVADSELLASAQLKDAEGADVGVVNLVSSDAGISFEFGLVEGATLEVGEHGFHVHETGTCEPDFEAAGAHLNPDGASHGLLSANGPHAGDLPNLVIPEDSAPTYVATTMRLTPEDLFDADGSAVIIHAGPDDYVTDPGGNSGDRVACGVLERVGE